MLPGESTGYALNQVPGAQTGAVVQARANVLKNIELNKLVTGLSRTGDLIYLAYNGVAGFGELTASLTELHDQFGKLCGKCDVDLGYFAAQSQQIQSILVDAFTALFDDEPEFAYQTLSDCGKAATALANKAEALAKEFDQLGDFAVQILASTEKTQAMQQAKSAEFKRKVADLNARTAKTNALLKSLREQKAKLEKLYNEAAEKADTAESRAFSMTFMSALMQPISAGLGTFAAIYTGGPALAVANTAKNILPTTPPPKDSTKADAEKREEDAKAELKDATEQAGEAQKAADTAKQAKDAADQVAAEKTEQAANARASAEKETDDDELAKKEAAAKRAEAEAKNASEQASKAKAAADAAKKQADDKAELVKSKQALLQSAVEALSKAGDNASKAGESYLAVAEDLRKEKMAYFKSLEAKQQMEAESLGDIEKYAIEIKNFNGEIDDVEIAVASLFLAIGALKQVAVVLRMANQFWTQMANACEQLADNRLKNKIEYFSKMAPEKRRTYIQNDRFKQEVIGYYAGWKAIEVVCQEYASEASKIQKRVHRDFATSLPIQEKRKKAKEMSETLLKDTEMDRVENEKEKSALQASIKAENEPKAAVVA
ncbi:hypothetical protein D7S89_15360 [Trinickia fusca]|uniref:Uncharacterized protein n=2 Tax=Trinickia fusca TaxID=2419777 RepID=A0A494XD68_9BURK|nr:hypothetical protein D7S89_15360 [Trinickia fusca]